MRKWFHQILLRRKESAIPRETSDKSDFDVSLPSEADESVIAKEAGDLHLRNGEFAAAAQCYRLAIAINPDYAKAFVNLGFALFEQEMHEEAELNLKRALELDITIADAHYMLGKLARMRGHTDTAILQFSSALEHAPDFEIAYLDLIQLLFQQGRVEAATQLMAKGISLNPTFANLHYCIGNLYYEQQQVNSAIDSFFAALAIDPDHAEAHASLGIVMLRLEDNERAITFLKKALALNPRLAHAHNGIGDILLRHYKLDEAITHYRAALAVDPDYVQAKQNLSDALQVKTRFDETGILKIAADTGNSQKVRLVCATRTTCEKFFSETPLGRSFHLYSRILNFLELQLFVENTLGLPTIYNQAIAHAEKDPAVLVFIHDDVFLVDFYWTFQAFEALQSFDILGVAGNKRRLPMQSSWCLVDDQGSRDEPQYLSGIVGHGDGFPCGTISVFGSPQQECKLLDGVILIVDSATLMRTQLRFDPRFDFHFYDMDFCRQAELKGLRMGTCPISLIHVGKSSFTGESWKTNRNAYFTKYGE